jgi:hypothetical protein
MKKVLGMCLLILVGSWACGHTPDSPRTVREVQIGETVEPQLLYANPGDEIRWQNMRAAPVRVGFLSSALLKELSCQKGVVTIFGGIRDFVFIRPQESASACFVRSGELKYNVWLEPNNPQGTISPTATIRVEPGG